MSLSPTALTLRELRKEGWTAQVVEHWVPGANVRRDLFGVIDVLALRDDTILGVQATSASNVSARIHKIADHPNLPAIRKAGIRLEVHGWAKKDHRWVCRRVDIS